MVSCYKTLRKITLNCLGGNDYEEDNYRATYHYLHTVHSWMHQGE